MRGDHVRPAAGCTDLFPASERQYLTGQILDISALSTLRGIAVDEQTVEIGSATTWTDILRAQLPPAFDALKSAAREVGSIQIQNAGTIGGNLCNASPAADGVPCLLTLDAEVELQSAERGARRLALSDFILGPRQTAIEADELLTKIIVPNHATTGSSSFLKLGARKYLVISIAMVAARLELETDRTIADVAIAVGSCSAVAQRLSDLEQALLGRTASRSLIDTINGRLIDQALAPIDDIRADADYRRDAAVETVKRVLRSLVVTP